MWTIGTDTGGTFTDLVAMEESGKIRVVKTPSTPQAFDQGVDDALRQADVSMDETSIFLHATTVATNTILTRTGAVTGLVATRGFRDVLELRDGSRGELYDINWDPPAPLVPRRRRVEVTERVTYRGEVIAPLSEDDVRAVAENLRAQGVESVAVCLFHSYANPRHEERVRTILEELLPGAYVSVSSEVLPEPPEFVRTATTVANAYVGPVLEKYLGRLADTMMARGYLGAVRIMHSGGGTMTVDTARRLPVRTSTSGPAAGVLACAQIARASGRPNAVSLDMGGTSADIGTIVGGRPTLSSLQVMEWGLPIRFPTIDVAVVGAGGGSIAWIDGAGVPHSGPQSAGARPGPACYGHGGTEPTNTDANLLLGRLRPESLLGGRLPLRYPAARNVISDRFAGRLGLTPEEAASAIVRLSNEHMANGIRRATVQRGLDPREFSLVAFGGAGPMHAVALARDLGMKEVIVPLYPGATSALGLLFSEVRHDLVTSWIAHEDAVIDSEIEAEFCAMQNRAQEVLSEEGFSGDSVRLECYVDIRYLGQVRVITLPVSNEAFRWPDAVAAFHHVYEQSFGYAVRELPVELASLRLVANGLSPNPGLTKATGGASTESALVGVHLAYFEEADDFVETCFYARDRLGPEANVCGPAVIEQFDSTTLLPPGSRATGDEFGNLVIDCYALGAQSPTHKDATVKRAGFHGDQVEGRDNYAV